MLPQVAPSDAVLLLVACHALCVVRVFCALRPLQLYLMPCEAVLQWLITPGASCRFVRAVHHSHMAVLQHEQAMLQQQAQEAAVPGHVPVPESETPNAAPDPSAGRQEPHSSTLVV